jgi:hypothetical protein
MNRLTRLALASLAGLASLTWVATSLSADDQPASAKPGQAAPDTKADDGFATVFNGKDLTGWVVTGDAKVAVEDGKLVLVDGNGFVRLEKVYGDFVFELEWKNRKPEKSDSGIYFRCTDPAAGQRWPDRYQINLLAGQEGSLVGSMTGKARNLAKAGEWNKLRMSVVGDVLEVEINGQPAYKVNSIKVPTGFVGLQCEVPGGGQFEFRNLRLKAITPPTDAPKK